MTAETPVTPRAAFLADSTLVNSIIEAVDSSLGMCGKQAECVGASTVPLRDPGNITGMLGVHGDVSGFITVNMAERVAFSLVGGLLEDRFDHLTDQIVDGVGEITNIVAGRIKSNLVNTQWSFRHVTVPSVIVGRNYQIAYVRGLKYLAVLFEHADSETLLLEDRLLQVAISVIRLGG